MDDKKLEVINKYIDKQQEYINDLLKKNLILESQNTYLNERVKELERLNKKNEDKTEFLKSRIAKKSSKPKGFTDIIGDFFGSKSDYDGELYDMSPVENINDEVYPHSIKEDKPKIDPSGKHVIRGGLPPKPKIK